MNYKITIMNGPTTVTVPFGWQATIRMVPAERRAPGRSHYQYSSSYDPRIRALERRGSIRFGDPIERRVATKDRRVSPFLYAQGSIERSGRRVINRRKA